MGFSVHNCGKWYSVNIRAEWKNRYRVTILARRLQLTGLEIKREGRLKPEGPSKTNKMEREGKWLRGEGPGRLSVPRRCPLQKRHRGRGDAD